MTQWLGQHAVAIRAGLLRLLCVSLPETRPGGHPGNNQGAWRLPGGCETTSLKLLEVAKLRELQLPAEDQRLTARSRVVGHCGVQGVGGHAREVLIWDD